MKNINYFDPVNEILERFDAIDRRLDAIEKLSDTSEDRRSDQLLNVAQCASMLDLQKSTVYRMTSLKKIPHYKRGGRLYFSRQEVLEWLKNKKNRKEVES